MRTWLKEFRLAKDLTQYDVAQRVGIQRSYYTMIESGNRTPSVHVAQSIGKVLGFDWTIFFTPKSNESLQKQSSA